MAHKLDLDLNYQVKVTVKLKQLFISVPSRDYFVSIFKNGCDVLIYLNLT
jgi:hypothetical protein